MSTPEDQVHVVSALPFQEATIHLPNPNPALPNHQVRTPARSLNPPCMQILHRYVTRLGLAAQACSSLPVLLEGWSCGCGLSVLLMSCSAFLSHKRWPCVAKPDAECGLTKFRSTGMSTLLFDSWCFLLMNRRCRRCCKVALTSSGGGPGQTHSLAGFAAGASIKRRC